MTSAPLVALKYLRGMSISFVKWHAERDFSARDFGPVLEGLSTGWYEVFEARLLPRKVEYSSHA